MATILPLIEIFANLPERKLSKDSSGSESTLPAFYPKKYSFRLKLLDRDADGTLRLIYPNVAGLSVSVGPIYTAPLAGRLKLKFGNSGTPTDYIEFNETQDNFKSKLAALPEATTYGLQEVYSPARSTWMARFANAVVNPLQVADNLLEPETFVRITDLLQNSRIWNEIRLIQAPLASTSAFDRLLANPPTVRRIREGVTQDEFLYVIKINEIQAITVPSDFLGTFAIKFQGQQTRMVSVTDGPDVYAAALNALYKDGQTRFVVTNPELHNAYVEFVGPFSGTPMPLMEIVIGATGNRELTFDLDFATAEVAAALRTQETVEAIIEAKVRVTDPDVGGDPGEEFIAFQSPVQIVRPLQWDGLEAAAGIDWLRPPNPIDYIPFDPGQVITGQQSYSAAFGDGSNTVFSVPHNLASDALSVEVRQNISGGRKLRDDEYTVVFNNINLLTVTIVGSPPASNALLISIFASGPKSAFENHTHTIGQVTGLQTEVDSIHARLTNLESLLPVQLPASPNTAINPFGAPDSGAILRFNLNDKAELLPLTRPPQNIDLSKEVTVTDKALPRAGILLPAVHKKADCALVANAGTSAVNAVYAPDGATLNGKPKYQLEGGTPDSDSITWSSTAWIIKQGGVSKYQSTDNVAYPWLATTWTVTGGAGPVPAVTATYPTYPAVIPLANTVTGRVFQVRASSAASAPGGSGVRAVPVATGDYVASDGRILYKVTKSDPPQATNYPGADVSGAGTATVNGEYLPDGNLLNAKPKFQLTGGTPDSDSITWSGTAWIIKQGGVSKYQSTNDVAYPWLVTTWTATGGASPVPVVSETPSANSFYPEAFDRELFRVAINDNMLKPDSTLTLRFDIWVQMFKQTSNAQYLLAVEFASTPAETSPAPVGPNLQDVIWDPVPVLQQRLIVTDTGVLHSFGVQVIRKADGTMRTNKKIYGTVLGGDNKPTSAQFAMRARLIEFDTENSQAGAQGLVYYRFGNSNKDQVASANTQNAQTTSLEIDAGASQAL